MFARLWALLENDMKMIKQSAYGTAVALALAAFVASVPAHAQGTAQERSACMGDAFKFCGSDIPNVSRIEACLKSNVSKLSPGCRAEFEPSGKTKIHRSHFN
jgi:hypothetical protein